MRFYEKYARDELQRMINESTSVAEVLKKMDVQPKGNNHTEFTKFVKDNDFNIENLVGRSIKRGKCGNKKSLEELLVNDSTAHSSRLRQRLVRNGILEDKCYLCGDTHHNGYKLTMHLHHINMIHTDNRLENIISLCPDCHSIVHNIMGMNNKCDEEKERLVKLMSEYSEENCKENLPKITQDAIEHKLKSVKKVSIPKIKKEPREIRKCEYCGKEFYKGKTVRFCSNDCYLKFQHANIIPKEILLEKSKTVHSLAELNRVLNTNVSDNAVKKWCDNYGIYEEVKSNFISRRYVIIQYDENHNILKEWDSADSIKKSLSYNKSKIQKACRSNKLYNGFYWQYKD